MKVVTRRTGLSPHVLRVWERRYAAVSPDRTESNRRLYTEAEVQRLILLKRATDLGHSISTVAGLPDPALKELLAREGRHEPQTGAGTPPPAAPIEEPDGFDPLSFVELSLEAVLAMNPDSLASILNRSALRLGHAATLEKVVVPLVERIGTMWAAGEMRPAHEHLATAVLRTFLGGFSGTFAPEPTAPMVVVTTPSGQLHELGAILVAAAARTRGWRVTYLGPSLPAEEIAGSVLQGKARAVALSLVYPADDGSVLLELNRLGGLLPAGVALLAGGRAACSYRAALDRAHALVCGSLADFYSALDSLRSRPTH